MILFDCEEPKPLRRPEVRNRVEGGEGALEKIPYLEGFYVEVYVLHLVSVYC